MTFLARLKSGLSKSSGRLTSGIAGIFTKRRLDSASVEELEELLIEADLGANVAMELTAALTKQRFEKTIAPEEVRQFLADEIARILAPYARPLILTPPQAGGQGGVSQISAHPPYPPAGGGVTVIMMVGVNGNGKTTTIGKLAAQFKAQGKSVMLAAADTFRAAAIDQLQVWGTRSGIEVIAGEPESDPASVAYRAYELAQAKGTDILLIDTAGRLQNKANLMAELQKIAKVLKKIDESAPHHVLLVLDATTGQNALSQVQAFKEIVHVTGLIITKLDGTAKGGIVVALAKQQQLPIHYIGIGEGIDDLDSFEAVDFAKNLLEL